MKSHIQLSTYAIILTLIVNIVLIVCCVLLFNEKSGFWVVLSLLILLLSLGLLYGPLQILADGENVTVRSVLRKQKIPMDHIESVELFQPTMGAYRLFASGGYFGYWGLFREGDVGKYMAYYGKASDCFLITMKNGEKYVLGCKNPEAMVEYINSRLQQTDSSQSQII